MHITSNSSGKTPDEEVRVGENYVEEKLTGIRTWRKVFKCIQKKPLPSHWPDLGHVITT